MIDTIDPYIDQLLNDSQTITESFERVSKATGEHFNLFTILGIESREVSTHSRFIAELLSPLGSHGKGRVFFDLFLEVFEIQNVFTEGLPKVLVERSFSKGAKGEKITGRVDILIVSNNGSSSILIENKIYAREQEDQLARYQSFLPDGNLFFLTLFGEESSQQSSKGIKYKAVSYKDNISNWLELCKKEAASSPILRETITIYLNLVKKLTNQNISSEMSNALVNRILRDVDNKSLSAYFDLLNSEKEVRDAIFKKRVIDSIQSIAADLNLKLQLINEFPYSKDAYSGFKLSDTLLEKNIVIEFQFQSTNWSGMIFGFTSSEELNTNIIDTFKESFGACESNAIWRCYRRFEGYENWGSREALMKINTSEFEAILTNIIKKLYEIAMM